MPIDRLQGDVSWEHRPDHTLRAHRAARVRERGHDRPRVRAVPDRGAGPRHDRPQCPAEPRQHRAGASLPAAGDRARGSRRGCAPRSPRDRPGEVTDEARRQSRRFPLRRRQGRAIHGRDQGQRTARSITRTDGRRCPSSTPTCALDGTRLTIDAARGRIAGIALGKFKVEIDDLRAEHPVLHIDGAGTMATADVLHFIESSPVAGWIDHYTDGAQATGNGRLELKLALPLGAFRRTRGRPASTSSPATSCGSPARRRSRRSTARCSSRRRAWPRATSRSRCSAGRRSSPSPATPTRCASPGAATPAIAALRREFSPPFGDAVSGTIDWTVAAADRRGVVVVAGEHAEGHRDRPAGAARQAGRRGRAAARSSAAAARRARSEDTLTVTYGQVGRLLLHRKLAAERRHRRSRAVPARPRDRRRRSGARRSSGPVGARRAAGCSISTIGSP